MSLVGFFDDLAPPPSPVPPPEPEKLPWMGPPAGWVGGWVPWHLVVLRSPDVYAVVTDFQAFPGGALFTLDTRVRPGVVRTFAPLPDPPPLMISARTGDLRFGVGFADGRKTALHSPVPTTAGQAPGPVLSLCGGTGGGGRDRMEVWLWPLPPEGSLTFAASWPTLGIEETVTTVDATDLVAASARAEQLWPDEPMGQWGGVSTVEIRHPPDSPSPEPDA